MSNPTPSRIARKLAGDIWPDVQHQRKLAPGIFDFSCAGHGGTVAVLDAAEMPSSSPTWTRSRMTARRSSR